jgi:peroxiredoxin
MGSRRVTTTLKRPLFPNWASIAITSLAAVAVVSLVWHLAEENRLLGEAEIAHVANAAPTRTPDVGDRLAAIDLVQLDGATATVTSLVAGGGVVAFLTTTCPFCEASLAQWGEVAATLAAAQIPFVAISLDNPEETRAFATDHGITWSLWAAHDSSRVRELRVNSVPVTAIVSPNAEITKIWRGQLRSADVDECLDAWDDCRASCIDEYDACILDC